MLASPPWRPRGLQSGMRVHSRCSAESRMSNSYAAVTVLIFAIVAIMHVVRIVKGWPVAIGHHKIPMSASWAGLVVAALLALWGVVQIG
jgi:hypothetical protein